MTSPVIVVKLVAKNGEGGDGSGDEGEGSGEGGDEDSDG